MDGSLRAQDNERIPATFVYAGIDLERQGLFTGIRGSQIAGRFTLIPTLRSRSPTSGGAWSPRSKTPSASAATRPGPWPGSTATSTSAPEG